MRVIITSPSLNSSHNISGVSAVTRFITARSTECHYIHFVLGKKDSQVRNYHWLGALFASYLKWIGVVLAEARAIVHFNVALDKRSLVRDLPLILTARCLGRRVVVHIHGGEFLAGPNAMPKWLKWLVAAALMGGPVIVLSELERKLLKGNFPRAQLFVLPNCVELEEAATFRRSYPTGEALEILFLGRIVITKGIQVLYEALAIASEAGVPFRFVMAGTGPEAESYAAKFRGLLGDRFAFLGVVTGEEKTNLLQTSQVFVLPSFFEGLPMALLESMAFGVVPIVTAVGSIPTVVADGQNGLLVQQHDPRAIAKALEQLAKDRLFLRRLSCNARRTILEGFDPDAYFAELRRIYEYGHSAGVSYSH
jgi:glycosyltransferase involved in cell wall biosynthesis